MISCAIKFRSRLVLVYSRHCVLWHFRLCFLSEMEVGHEGEDMKVHFSGVVEQLKARYGAREESFSKMIEELEEENAQLIGDVDSQDEIIAGLRTSLELRDAEIARLREIADVKHAPAPRTDAAAPLKALAASCSLLIDVPALYYTGLLSLTSTAIDASLLATLVREEVLARAHVVSMEEELRLIAQQWAEQSARMVESSKAAYRTLCRRSVEALLHVAATNCLQNKSAVVVDEDAAWSLIYESWDAINQEQPEAPLSIEEPESFDSVFWDCCLEEAQSAMRSIPMDSEDDLVLRDVCAVVDLPELLQAARAAGGPTDALAMWSRHVVGPLQRVLGGNESFTQLSNTISEALEALRT